MISKAHWSGNDTHYALQLSSSPLPTPQLNWPHLPAGAPVGLTFFLGVIVMMQGLALYNAPLLLQTVVHWAADEAA